MDRIGSQIIVLTKNIILRKPTELRERRSFFAGRNSPFDSSRAITWWCDSEYKKALENLSFIINSEVSRFSGCDHETIQNVTEDTFCAICLDKEIFHFDISSGAENLFSCIKKPKLDDSIKLIKQEIFSAIDKQTYPQCSIFALPSVYGNSFEITYESVHIIHKDDSEYWAKLSEKGYLISNFDPVNGNADKHRSLPFTNIEYTYLIAVEAIGTKNGCKQVCKIKIRRVLAILFAVLRKEEQRLWKSIHLGHYNSLLQFPHLNSIENGTRITPFDEIIPTYGNDIKLNKKNIKAILCWYEALERMESEQKNRREKCAHFFNLAMNSENEEAFILYFIALDALYGIKGNVENSIKDGVKNLCNDQLWEQKIDWLYKLRNELVHGGSRYIHEWPKYLRYYKHFSSEPINDIEKLVCNALLEIASPSE